MLLPSTCETHEAELEMTELELAVICLLEDLKELKARVAVLEHSAILMHK